MRYPLDGTITVTGEYKEKAQPGTGLADAGGVRRHIGLDMRAPVGTKVYAPASGVVTSRFSGSAGNTLEVRIAGKLWRFMHLSKFNVQIGNVFNEGAVLAYSGNSGGVAAHLHVDVRKDGTTWSQSLNNFYDMRAVIDEANKPAPHPSNGKRLHFTPIGQTATFYPVKGGTFAMKIVDDEGWSVLEDQGYRVRVNSRSAGGDCWVYMIWQTGANKGKAVPGRYLK